MKATVWDSRRCSHGEGPTSSGISNNHVMWVDISGKMVLWRDLYSGEIGSHKNLEDTSFAIPRVSGGEILGTSSGPIVRDLDGAIHSLPTRIDADGFADKYPTRWNDAKVAPTGDLWLGTMTYKADAGEGALYRLTKDRKTLQRILSGVTISNGMGWSSDGSTFYYIDSPTLGIDAFDFHGDQISDRRRIWSTSEKYSGIPDGMTMDSEGGMWVAFWEGSCIRRIDSDFQVSEVIELPVKLVTSCTFAGSDLKTLIITTSQGDPDYRDKSPLAGMTFAIELDVAGVPTNLFPN